jgi:hypothetical protein
MAWRALVAGEGVGGVWVSLGTLKPAQFVFTVSPSITR